MFVCVSPEIYEVTRGQGMAKVASNKSASHEKHCSSNVDTTPYTAIRRREGFSENSVSLSQGLGRPSPLPPTPRGSGTNKIKNGIGGTMDRARGHRFPDLVPPVPPVQL